jgi:hypothetical protein
MRFSSIIATITFIILAAGCSGNSTQITASEFPITGIHSLPIGVTDLFPDGSPSGGSGQLGLFNITIDPENLYASLEPVRQVALADVLEDVDITNFLRMAPCNDCVKIRSVTLDSDNHVVLSIGIKHPFPAGDSFKPISGRNRGDLHVFNIEGIVVSDSAGQSFPNLGNSLSAVNLVNADGYTGYLDNSLDSIFPTSATIHPFILHFDDYSAGNFNPSNPMGFESVTTPPPMGNLVMAMGCDYNYQDYIFDITDHFNFIYAVGCTYAVSASSKSTRFTPEYRVPQHNKKAASEVGIEIISNNLNGGDTSSSAQIEIHVVDINHSVDVGTAPNQMFADSSVVEIRIEIPGITDNPVIINGNSSISGSGHDPSDPLIYQTSVINALGASQGTYPGLVKVLDSYNPGQNTSPLLNGMDGIKRVSPVDNPLTGLFAITEFATYQVFSINVGSGCGPITGEILEPDCPVDDVTDGETIDFTVTASSANGGDPIILYEMDFDYDGTTFTADDSSTDGIFDDAGPFNVPDPCDENIPYTFTVAFRATDSCTTPNITIFATCDVTVDSCNENCIPQNTTIIVNRIHSGLYDAHRIDTDNPFTITWDVPDGCTPESYAIYADRDPDDGYSNDYQFVAEINHPTTTWTGDSAEFVSVERYVPGWTYIVRARLIEGDPSSEGGDSEQVHVITSSFETCPGWDTSGGIHTTLNVVDTEGWKATQQNTYDTLQPILTTNSWTHDCTSNPCAVYGCGYVFMDIGLLYSAGQWMGMTRETPVPSTMPGIEVRQMDFATHSVGYHTSGSVTGGLVVGTCPYQPADLWTTPEDFDWASVDSTGSYEPYQPNNMAFVYETFDNPPYNDVPTSGSNCWYYFSNTAGNWADKRFRGSNLNIDGDINDPYVGIMSCMNATSGFDPETRVDEVSIAIY